MAEMVGADSGGKRQAAAYTQGGRDGADKLLARSAETRLMREFHPTAETAIRVQRG
jgi:hypothetical protein